MQQNIQYRMAMDIKLDKVLAKTSGGPTSQVTVLASDRLLSLADDLGKGHFQYTVDGQLGDFFLEQGQDGKIFVSEITLQNASDPKAMRALIEKLMQNGYDFAPATKVGKYTIDLKRPPYFLSKNKVKKPYHSVERRSAGSVLTHKSDLPQENLQDGQYVYLTYFNLKNGEYTTVTSPIYELNTTSGRYYIGHRALHNKFGRRELVVVAGGEFIIRHGEFARLSNRSGNFMGGSANLDFAKETFASKGFDVRRTVLSDLDQLRRANPDSHHVTEEGVHNDAFTKAQYEYELRTNPKYEEAIAAGELMLKRMYEAYPHPEKVGFVDRSAVLGHLRQEFETHPDFGYIFAYIVQVVVSMENEGMAIAIKNSESPYMPVALIANYFTQVAHTLRTDLPR